MSANFRLTGKDLVIIFQTGGNEYILSGDQNSLDVTQDSNQADMTAGNDEYTYAKVTTKRRSANLATKYTGTNGTATWGMLQEGAEGTLLWGVGGTTTGKPKGGFPATLTAKNPNMPFDNAIVSTASFAGQGGVFGTSVFDMDKHTW
jgi:hypothetical protein